MTPMETNDQRRAREWSEIHQKLAQYEQEDGPSVVHGFTPVSLTAIVRTMRGGGPGDSVGAVIGRLRRLCIAADVVRSRRTQNE